MSNVCSLMKIYKCHTVKLCTTENGVRDEQETCGSNSGEYTLVQMVLMRTHLVRPKIFGVCDVIVHIL